MGWRSTDREGGALIGRFAVLSFLVIAVTTAVLSYVLASSLERDMLAREWQVTGTYVRLEAARFLRPGDFASPRDDGAEARFREFYEQMMRVPETIRVKVFDTDGTILWSDEARLIGQRFVDNPQLALALHGETIAHLETKATKTENQFETRKRFVELYVPLVFPPDARVAGIAELYKAPEGVFANIARGRRIVVGTSLAGGVLLWASLFGIVRAAGRRIERQHRDLQQQSRELAAANDELRTVQEQLVAAERLAAVGEVVAAVAHGIRNPLANVRASAQLALLDCRQCSPAAAAENITHAISEVDRLGARVGDLLRFVRPAERRSERLDLNEVVTETLRLMKERFAAGNVRVVDRLDAAAPPIVADFALLEQALGALVENALDAMNGEGTLTVTTGTEAVGSRVFVEVTDTGPGIPPASLRDVFTLFYTTKARGTGLGLALAKKFVEGYDGTLTVTSRPGEGARFRATFPVAEG
jgi:two-component system sensor histidine kinase HydH